MNKLNKINKWLVLKNASPKGEGQSLIETIVAVGVTVMGIVAILSMAAAHLSMGGQSAERVIATNLAREGVELVFAIRNSNWLDPAQFWPYGAENGNWIVSYNATSLTAADSATISQCDNCKLYLTDSDVYTHTVGTNTTVYRRLIAISNITDLDPDYLGGNCNNNCEKKIISTVYWVERGRPHTINTEARITGWR